MAEAWDIDAQTQEMRDHRPHAREVDEQEGPMTPETRAWSDLTMATGKIGRLYYDLLLTAAKDARSHIPGKIGQVLEVGCGSGKLGLGLARLGFSVHLVDIDGEQIAYSKRLRTALEALLGKELRVEYRTLNIHNLPPPMHGRFDLVFNEGVLEHFYEADADGYQHHDPTPLWNMVACAKSGGVVAAFVPNALSPVSQRIAAETHHHYVGMPEKEVPFRPEAFRAMLSSALLDVQLTFIHWDSDTKKGESPLTPEDCRHIFGWGRKP